jgi:hypothetical protein
MPPKRVRAAAASGSIRGRIRFDPRANKKIFAIPAESQRYFSGLAGCYHGPFG